ncbi:MAG: glycosyltransferase family 2 protein [Prosthecobacter sp.]
MELELITPLVLTFNEEPNLRRCLGRLTWAKEVVVVDSGSKDATLDIAAEFPNVRVIVRPFDDHTTQWNFGLDCTNSNWVLTLDCDYVLSEGFEQELAALPAEPVCDAFFASFRYLIHGKALRGCLYPMRAVFFRKDRCRYIPDGHTQLLKISGPVLNLRSLINHDDRKPLSRWFASQAKYAALEAQKLLAAPRASLRIQDRLRLTGWAAIPASLVYTLLVKRVILDGWRGWYYSLQRILAEIMLTLEILERRIDH